MFDSFLTLFLSIVVEAFPFLVMGTLVASMIRHFNISTLIIRFLPKHNLLAHLYMSLFGVLLPVCECGNIPVARQLTRRGISVSQTVTFLLAAPIINPITIWSTYAAFGNDSPILWWRIIGGISIAVLTGWILSFEKNETNQLTSDFSHECSHAHHESKFNGFFEFIDNFRSEFFAVFWMLLWGAALATAVQLFVPREIVIAIGTNPILSVVAMMTLAFVVSICSNVDAFFALSYASLFSPGSLVAFLIFGPMIDMKILTMLSGTFKKEFLIKLSFIVFLQSLAFGLLANLV